MVGAEAMKGGQVIRLHAERFLIAAAVGALSLPGCNSTAEPLVVDGRAIQVVGTVQSAQLSPLGGEISLRPDPTGNCPASESQTTTGAPPAVSPIDRDGSFVATILVLYYPEDTPQSEICVHVAVFLKQGEEIPDSAFSAGQWTFGSSRSPPTQSLSIVF